MPKTKPAHDTRNPAKYSINIWSARIVDFFSSRLFLKLTLILFLAEAAFFALRIRFGLPPDENYHFSFIRLLASDWPSPFINHQSGFDVVYDAMRTPFFIYHYLLALPYLLIQWVASAYVILRFINIGLALASLVVVKHIADQLHITALARNISLFALTNTLMFTFLSSAVSYDNLFILVCLLITWTFIDLWQRVTTRTLLLFMLLLLVGSLVKINFLAFGFFIAAVLGYKLVRDHRQAWIGLRRTAGAQRWQNIGLALLIVTVGFLFVSRYGINIVRYHTYDPPCASVRSEAACRSSGLVARTEYINSHRLPAMLSMPHYVVAWTHLMLDRTYGIFAHKRFTPSLILVLLIATYLAAGVACFAWSRPKDPLVLAVVLSTLGYVAALFVTNYLNFRSSGRVDLAVHGRYLFNVLPIAYLFINNALLRQVRTKRHQAVLLIAVVGLFIAANIPTFATHVSASWFVH